MPPDRFRKTSRPNAEVVQAIEQALEAAKQGHIRAIVIIAANPLHEVEMAIAGAIHGAVRHVLIGGLSSAAHKLIANHTPHSGPKTA